jgi:threonine/homoserine/homoserine lactone efflux protein
MPTHLAAFVITLAFLAMLPGANNASITRQTLMSGRRAGLLAVAGASSGILIWASAAAFGLSAVLLANPNAYLAIRIGGAAVLCVLGAQSLWAMRKPPATEPASTSCRCGDATGRRSFAVGVATSLGNPKAGVFAVSLIPQFVTAHGRLYVWTVDKARARANKPTVQRFMQAATGLTMLGLGIAVAVGT